MIDSNGEEIELKEGGKSIPIDMSNREDYLNAKAYYLLITKNEQALEAFRTGFEKFFPLIVIFFFFFNFFFFFFFFFY